MALHLVILIAVTLTAFGYYWWLYRVVLQRMASGDQWYMTRMAYTDDPITAPYCWRPLVPILGRWFGFPLITYGSVLATPIMVYFLVGGGWPGAICGLVLVGNHHIFSFSIKNPEYADGVGQFLMISSLLAMSTGHPVAWPLMILCGLCRETIWSALVVIALVWNPWLALPLVFAAVIAYFGRNEDKDNTHPLIEKTIYETVKRWAGEKKLGFFHFGHIIQPIRGIAFVVPFVWERVLDFSRLGLVGCVPIIALALPASGQSRIVAYSFGLFIPFVAVLPIEWCWIVCGVSWFWPAEVRVFDEAGKTSFAVVKG